MLNHFPREMNLNNYKEIIEKYFIDVGLTEFLPESLQRFAQKLGVPFRAEELGHLNATARTDALPDEYRAVFRESHPLEYAVYDYVRARFAPCSEAQG